jgi:hypothetical protein
LAGQGPAARGVEGVYRFHTLVAEHVEDPGDVVVATETDRGLFVGSLVAAGYEVYRLLGARHQPNQTSTTNTPPGVSAKQKLLDKLGPSDVSSRAPAGFGQTRSP